MSAQPAPKRRGRPPKAVASAAPAGEGSSAAAESVPLAEKPAHKRSRPSKKGEWLPSSYPTLTSQAGHPSQGHKSIFLIYSAPITHVLKLWRAHEVPTTLQCESTGSS